MQVLLCNHSSAACDLHPASWSEADSLAKHGHAVMHKITRGAHSEKALEFFFREQARLLFLNRSNKANNYISTLANPTTTVGDMKMLGRWSAS